MIKVPHRNLIFFKPVTGASGGIGYEIDMIAALGGSAKDIPKNTRRVPSLVKYFKRLVYPFFAHYSIFCLRPEIVIATIGSLVWVPRGFRVVLLVHHYDPRGGFFGARLYNWFFFQLMSIFKHRLSAVVVVSEFWRRFLRRKGFTNIYVIYNSFDTELIKKIRDSDTFLNLPRMLQEKEYVYVGKNGANKIGHSEILAIKASGYGVVETGTGRRLEGVTQLGDLKYTDYLSILKHARFISLYPGFSEGWNRTAHEAGMLGTPVVGWPRGGMIELSSLIGMKKVKKNQLRCWLANNDTFGAPLVLKYRNFSKEIFKKRWLQLFDEISF